LTQPPWSRMRSSKPFAQTLRTNQTIKRTRRTVPRIPPMYMSVSVQLCGQPWKHAHVNCVGALTYNGDADAGSSRLLITRAAAHIWRDDARKLGSALHFQPRQPLDTFDRNLANSPARNACDSNAERGSVDR
jgi:hypothetical protein